MVCSGGVNLLLAEDLYASVLGDNPTEVIVARRQCEWVGLYRLRLLDDNTTRTILAHVKADADNSTKSKTTSDTVGAVTDFVAIPDAGFPDSDCDADLFNADVHDSHCLSLLAEGLS